MKKLLSCFVLIFPVLVYAQSNNSSWGAINKFVNAAGFAGKRFRLEAAVKIQVIDPAAQAELWMRLIKPKWGFDLFAEDMNALLDHLHIDSARIVGWSDGGNTGLIMAMKYPAKVKQLVTMGANVFIDKTVVDKIVFKEIDRQLKQLENDTTAWGKNRVRLLKMLLTEPRHTFEDLKAIHCPVLVVAGENDLILPEHTKGIAGHISRGTLLIAPKETHDYPSQNAVSFNKAVLDFFEKR